MNCNCYLIAINITPPSIPSQGGTQDNTMCYKDYMFFVETLHAWSLYLKNDNYYNIRRDARPCVSTL